MINNGFPERISNNFFFNSWAHYLSDNGLFKFSRMTYWWKILDHGREYVSIRIIGWTPLQKLRQQIWKKKHPNPKRDYKTIYEWITNSFPLIPQFTNSIMNLWWNKNLDKQRIWDWNHILIIKRANLNRENVKSCIQDYLHSIIYPTSDKLHNRNANICTT